MSGWNKAYVVQSPIYSEQGTTIDTVKLQRWTIHNVYPQWAYSLVREQHVHKRTVKNISDTLDIWTTLLEVREISACWIDWESFYRRTDIAAKPLRAFKTNNIQKWGYGEHMHCVSKNVLSQMQEQRTVYVVWGKTVSNPVWTWVLVRTEGDKMIDKDRVVF